MKYCEFCGHYDLPCKNFDKMTGTHKVCQFCSAAITPDNHCVNVNSGCPNAKLKLPPPQPIPLESNLKLANIKVFPKRNYTDT